MAAVGLVLTVNVDVLLALIILVQPLVPPDCNWVMVIVVEPAVLKAAVLKLPLPAVVTVIVEVAPVAVLVPLKL